MIRKTRAKKLAALMAILAIAAASSANMSSAEDQSASHVNQVKAIRLKQTHVYLGNIEVTIAAGGVRMEGTGRMHFTLVSSAPDWSVQVFRSDDKVLKKEGIPQFANEGLVPEIMLPYRAHVVGGRERPYKFKVYGFDALRVVTPDDIVEYLPLEGITSRPVEQILFACYRLPTNGGVPVHNIRSTAGTDFITGLSVDGHESNLTTSSIKATWVPKDYFIAPKDYRQVKAMQEILTSSKAREQSEDFQALMEGPGHKVKHKDKPQGRL